MKIDVEKIVGFNEMTAEDKVNALLGYEFEETKQPVNDDGVKLKAMLSKASSEAAEYKRKMKALMDENQQKEFERQEADRVRDEELTALRKEKTLSVNKSKLMEIGYDSTTADIMANALPDIMSDEYFLTQKAFLENQRKTIESDFLNRQPNLTQGTIPTSKNVEDERLAAIRRAAGLR